MNLLPEVEKDKRIAELEQALASELRLRHAAEQDCQHWRERCEDLLEVLQPLAALGECVGSRYEDDAIIATCGATGTPVHLRVGDARKAVKAVKHA